MVDIAGNKLYYGDCLAVMQQLINEGVKVDMVLTDLPYGVLNKSNENAGWDSVIDLSKMWQLVDQLTNKNTAKVFFGSGIFTCDLINSNRKEWRYNLIWDKIQKSGFLNSKRMPLRRHEDIIVFYKSLPKYNPQMEKCEPHKRNHSKGDMTNSQKNNCYGKFYGTPTIITDEKYPSSIIQISRGHKVGQMFHPSEKPTPLLEYLIKTYTDEGDLVLDLTAGSFSTGVACMNTKRRFIGIENNADYYEVGIGRMIKNL